MTVRSGRQRPEKILVAMHRLAKGTTAFLDYEDIVVAAFRMFPDEFALRGHPEFPDSSDVHKPLYGVLKKRGLVKSAQKQFSLTPRGVEVAEGLVESAGDALDATRSADRLTRSMQAELDRMLKSEAYRLFSAGERDRILDTDFYAFFGCTVRTERNAFAGRLEASREAAAVARKLGSPTPAVSKEIGQLVSYLGERFKAEIGWKAKKHA